MKLEPGDTWTDGDGIEWEVGEVDEEHGLVWVAYQQWGLVRISDVKEQIEDYIERQSL